MSFSIELSCSSALGLLFSTSRRFPSLCWFSVFIHSSPQFGEHFMSITGNALSGKLFISVVIKGLFFPRFLLEPDLGSVPSGESPSGSPSFLQSCWPWTERHSYPLQTSRRGPCVAVCNIRGWQIKAVGLVEAQGPVPWSPWGCQGKLYSGWRILKGRRDI